MREMPEKRKRLLFTLIRGKLSAKMTDDPLENCDRNHQEHFAIDSIAFNMETITCTKKRTGYVFACL
jgi:hypothetical protein